MHTSSLVALAYLCFHGVCTAEDRPPNIILIMADDLGYECIAANGGESYRTPNLDRSAAGGMRFENCFVQPLCTPTRVQLMTGLYNVRNYTRFGHLDPKATTFAHVFKKAGYATAIAGKWQLGREAHLPKHFGFDTACLWQHTRRPPRFANPGLEYDGVEKDFNNGEYGPDLVNEFALEFIERHRDRPFLLYYPMILTHDPFQPTPDSPDWDPTAIGEQVNRHRRHFGEMVTYMDKLIGKADRKLGELGIRDNTLLIFLGDNGTHPSITSRFKGKPYQGGKRLPTTAGMHVPLIASWPGTVPAGRVNRDLIDSTDFFPTICEAAGIEPPSGLDGRSFLPQLRGEKGTPREWMYCWYSRNGGARAKHEFARTARYKLTKEGMFYDLLVDPLEERPIEAAKLEGEPLSAANSLRDALKRYAEARPIRMQEVR